MTHDAKGIGNVRDEGVAKLDAGLEKLTEESVPADDGLKEKIWIPERTLELLAALLLIALTLFIVVSVVMRFAGHGILGAVELSAISMVVLTVFITPAATALDENFKVEIVDLFAGTRTISGFVIFGAFVQVVVSAFLFGSALEMFLSDVSTIVTMGGELAMHRYWLTLSVLIGFTVLLHAAIVFLLRSIRAFRAGNNPADDPASGNEAEEG